MVVVVVTMMMLTGSESGACAGQYQKREEQNLLHGLKRITIRCGEHESRRTGIKTATVCADQPD
jgi:hypothetical protein